MSRRNPLAGDPAFGVYPDPQSGLAYHARGGRGRWLPAGRTSVLPCDFPLATPPVREGSFARVVGGPFCNSVPHRFFSADAGQPRRTNAESRNNLAFSGPRSTAPGRGGQSPVAIFLGSTSVRVPLRFSRSRNDRAPSPRQKSRPIRLPAFGFESVVPRRRTPQFFRSPSSSKRADGFVLGRLPRLADEAIAHAASQAPLPSAAPRPTFVHPALAKEDIAFRKVPPHGVERGTIRGLNSFECPAALADEHVPPVMTRQPAGLRLRTSKMVNFSGLTVNRRPSIFPALPGSLWWIGVSSVFGGHADGRAVLMHDHRPARRFVARPLPS